MAEQKQKKKRLNPREKKFVKAKIQGKTHLQAWKEAGYSTNNPNSAVVEASNKYNKPHIQQAIDDALQMHGATPEWAVAQLMKVAGQDDELGAKRLASKDILELHGWNKADRPTVQLQVKNAFFQGGRDIKKPESREENTQEAEIIDGDTAEVQTEQ